jgi:hypothetical protein
MSYMLKNDWLVKRPVLTLDLEKNNNQTWDDPEDIFPIKNFKLCRVIIVRDLSWKIIVIITQMQSINTEMETIKNTECEL